MKKVILVRHAESGWEGPSQSDHERTLTEKGIADAKIMADILRRKNILPELFYTSSAVRAQQTAKIFMGVYGADEQQIVVKDSLYEPKQPAFSKVIENAPQHISTMIVFSHNPGISEFASALRCHTAVQMPPCGVFIFSFDADEWSSFHLAERKFISYDVPR